MRIGTRSYYRYCRRINDDVELETVRLNDAAYAVVGAGGVVVVDDDVESASDVAAADVVDDDGGDCVVDAGVADDFDVVAGVAVAAADDVV